MITYAGVEEIPQLMKFAEEFYKSSELSVLPFNHDKVYSIFHSFASDPFGDGIIFLVYDSGKIVSCLVATLSEVPFSDERIAIELMWWSDPASKPLKDTLNLINCFEKWAKAKGCRFATMSHLGTNPKIDKFYTRKHYKLSELAYIKEL